MTAATLDAFLNSYVGQGDALRTGRGRDRPPARRGRRSRSATRSTRARSGAAFAGTRGANADGDVQKDLDVFADDIFLDAMRHAPVALYASEELEQPVLLDADAPLAVAIDPLDGSSNIDTNVSIGTIFSLLPATGAPDADPAAAFLQAGANQLGAGFFIYGPQLALVLSLGSGTHVFVFSARLGAFVQAYESRDHPGAHPGIRHQRRQLPALGRGGAALCRRLPEGHRRPARARLQHALDRLAGRRMLPHPDARRRLPLSRRPAQGLPSGPAAPGLRGQPDRLPDRAGRRRGHRHASTASSTSSPRACTSACRWCSARRARSHASPATTPTRAPSASARRCSAIAACSAPDGAEPCRPSIPSSRSPALPAPARPR